MCGCEFYEQILILNEVFLCKWCALVLIYSCVCVLNILFCILLACSVYCWLVQYIVGLFSILLACSVYCWLVQYIVGLFSILLACSVYCWIFQYIVGFFSILLACSDADTSQSAQGQGEAH